LVRLVEIEVPQAIGVLNKILRNLEEYHAIRARDPRAAYDDVSIAKAIWGEGATADEAENVGAGGKAVAASEKNGEAAADPNTDAQKETN
jgi:hypothetical protein